MVKLISIAISDELIFYKYKQSPIGDELFKENISIEKENVNHYLSNAGLFKLIKDIHLKKIHEN